MSLHTLLLLLFLSFFIHQSLANPHHHHHHHHHHDANFTATLFFGDSTLDTGNNKFIDSAFRSNHFPYGLDFPDRVATGRFSNGLLVPDLLTQALNIKPLSPPWLDPGLSDEDIRTGVNFASAGAGLDDLTSTISNTVSLSGQLAMFGEYVERLEAVAGEEEGRRKILENALVMFGGGGNDVIINYYDLPSKRRTQFATMSDYQDFLLGKLEDAVKNVYSHGCRRFILTGLPPIGCLPVQMTTAGFGDPPTRKCIDEQMADTHSYNTKLQNLLPKLQQTLPGSKLAYLDVTNTVLDMFNHPAKYGFEETKRGCCGTGFIEMGPLCNQFTPVCKNISSFAFFDAIHPTERVYKLVTEHIMKNVIHKLY